MAVEKNALPTLINIRQKAYRSKIIHVFDVSGILCRSDDLVLVIDRDIFVNNLVLKINVLADLGVSCDVAAFHYGALADLNTAADHGIYDAGHRRADTVRAALHGRDRR